MANREGQPYDYWEGSFVSWQYCRNSPEYKKKHSQKQANQNGGGKYTLLYILFIICFIALLATRI
jgi:hypothetical protein